MKLAIVLIALIAIVIVSAHPKKGEFKQWMVKHNKQYKNNEEHEMRFNNWLNSGHRVVKKNRENGGTVNWGLNGLSDLSEDEFKNLLGYKQSSKPKPYFKPVPNASLLGAPNSFDWCLSQGMCTPIKNQEQCGSCWAFATTENIESVWAIAGKANALTPLAPQEIVDCDTGEEGCNGGDPAQAYPWVAQEGGMDTEANYPYTGEDGTCAFPSGQVVAQISSYANGYGGSEQQMAANLASTAPFSIIVDASSWQDYTSGILPASQCGTSLDHAVIAAGYDMNSGYWNVRNSWGSDWGMNGYIQLQFGQNTCGMTTEVLTATL